MNGMIDKPLMDDLDAVLNDEESITPSPGFAASVMRAVRLCASLSLPIRFPWLRFAVCLILGLVCLLSTSAIVLVADFSNPAFPEMAYWVKSMHQVLANGVLYATLILIGCLLAVRLIVEFAID